MHILNAPLKVEDIENLKIGEKVLLTGTIYTARDRAHLFLLQEDFPRIRDGIIYHCGPIVRDKEVIAAGPTTSARMNKYTPELIKKYNIRAIIGKGGMNDKVKESLKGQAVYLTAIGGAAVNYADCITVKNVYKPEFGMPESIWEMEVKNFPVFVTIDSQGNSLYDDIQNKSKEEYERLLENSNQA